MLPAEHRSTNEELPAEHRFMSPVKVVKKKVASEGNSEARTSISLETNETSELVPHKPDAVKRCTYIIVFFKTKKSLISVKFDKESYVTFSRALSVIRPKFRPQEPVVCFQRFYFSVLSLFTIVSFKNDACVSTTTSGTNGTCYSSSDCSNLGERCL
jgi:hypothetical protein